MRQQQRKTSPLQKSGNFDLHQKLYENYLIIQQKKNQALETQCMKEIEKCTFQPNLEKRTAPQK